jgi:rhodanese-related sulfurtransferase
MGIFDMFFGPRVPQVDVQEAHKRLQNPQAPIIVDVRQPVETGSGAIPGAVLIPLTQFSARFRDLPPDRPILTICRSSHRSPLAARQLKQAGYNVTDVKGGMLAWEQAGLPIERK